MDKQDTVFLTLVKMLLSNGFEDLVSRFQSDRYSKTMNTKKLFMALLLAHLAKLTSLRELEIYTECHEEELAKVGLRRVPKSTLAEALERTDAALFETFYQGLVKKFSKYLSKEDKKKTKEFVLAIIDSSLIRVGAKRFPWARYHKSQGAIKMHVMLHHDKAHSYVENMVLTEGATADITVAKEDIGRAPDSIFVCDRGYQGNALFKKLTREGQPFVIRIKEKTKFKLVVDMDALLNRKRQCEIEDDLVTIEDKEFNPFLGMKLRRVVIPPFPGRTDKVYFLTNDFDRTASEIGEIYHTRWQIETFFKWIKGNLPVKSFFGTSPNAIKIQLLMGFTTHLLLNYLKALSNQDKHLRFYLLRLRARLFKRVTLIEGIALSQLPKLTPILPILVQGDLFTPT